MQTESKKVSHVPNGFSAVTPYFQVEDGETFLNFVQDAFGAEPVDIHREDGRIRHFAVKVFGAMIEGSEVAGTDYSSRELAIHRRSLLTNMPL